MNNLKIIAIAFISILILNMLLLATKIISPVLFWVVIIIIGLLTYALIPRK